MVRAQIQFTEEQMRKLKQAGRRLEISVAEVVRRCVDMGLGEVDAEGRKRAVERALAAAGRFASGLSDVARNHDDYLYGDKR